MFNFLLIILSGIGITNLLINSSILEPIRKFIGSIVKYILNEEKTEELLSCMMCMGFWLGLILGVFSNENPLFIGFSVSLLSFLYGKVIDYLDVSTAIKAIEINEREKNNE